MALWVPGWLQGGTYTAQQDRINSRAAAFDEGVADRLAFKVSQRAAGANLTVDVAAGTAIVTGDDQAFQGNYDVFSDAAGSVSGFVATSANTRYDLVGIQINDPNAGGAAGNNAVLTRVAGTQAASPTIPNIPNSFLPLAIIGPFTTTTTAITNSMIHDAYTGTGPTGVAGVRLLQGFRDAPGTMKDTFNAVAPNGWLIAAGQAVSRSVFAGLFEHFGTTFGVGDGSSTFNLPDLRGRVIVALDNQGGTDAGVLDVANVLGAKAGEQYHALTIAELASHTHVQNNHVHGGIPSYGTIQIADTGSGTFVPDASVVGSTSTDPGAGTNQNTGSGTPLNVMQPYILGYKIVRT